jgi:hypothetical protein
MRWLFCIYSPPFPHTADVFKAGCQPQVDGAVCISVITELEACAAGTTTATTLVVDNQNYSYANTNSIAAL